MLTRHARAAVAIGLAADDEAAALTARTTADPLLRRLIHRKVGKVLLAAMSGSGEAASGGDVGATRHNLRATALLLAGRREVDLTSRAAVAAAHAALPPLRAPSRLPWLTGISVALGLACSALFVAKVVLTPDPPSKVFDRFAVPARADAFTVGGRPRADAALEVLLRDDLTAHLLAVNADVREPRPPGGVVPRSLVEARATLAAAPAITAAPPSLGPAWQDLLVAMGEWNALPGGPGMNGRFSDACRGFSKALADAGIGLYLDGDVLLRRDDRAELVLYAYQVLDVRFVQAAGTAPMRVLTLRRLDRLNIERPALGMQSKELGDPLVLLDQIEDQVATHALPVLGAKGHYAIGDASFERRDGDVPALLTAVDGALRAETLAALGRDAPASAEVGALLADRRGLMGMMKTELRGHGWHMGTLEGVYLPDDFFEQVDDVIDEEQLAPLRKIEDGLLTHDAARIAALVEDLVIASVRRHEAQHAYDDRTPPGYPPVLEAACGPLSAGEWDRPFAQACQAELSAYLSQIASDRATPQGAVWSMARHSFDASAWGSATSVVATIALLELGQELGAPAPTDAVLGRRSIDRAALLPIAMAVVHATPDALRAAAARAWAQLFGRPYTVITDVATP